MPIQKLFYKASELDIIKNNLTFKIIEYGNNNLTKYTIVSSASLLNKY